MIGALDLSSATVSFPVSFENSLFDETIQLSQSQLIDFTLTGSHIHGIEAAKVTVRNNFTLDNISSEGEVDLLGGNLGGTLVCQGSTLKNPGALALVADNAKVGGNVFLRGAVDSQGKAGAPFSAEGEVSLMGADVNGDLDCDGATFNNQGEIALGADRLKVGGGVFLGSAVNSQGNVTPFKADGEVRLLGADVRGNLECIGATFKNPSKIALNADRLKVGGNVFLRGAVDSQGKAGAPFSAEGEVNLAVADIGGSLECLGATFKNPRATALNGNLLKVGGAVFLSGALDNQGKVITPFNAEGEVNLGAADIKSNLECDGGTFKNPRKTALNGDSLKVGGNVFLRRAVNSQGKATPFLADGEVNLLGADVRGGLECDGGTFMNPGATALDAERLKVGGNVFLGRAVDSHGKVTPFNAEGEVDLIGGDIRGGLECDGGTFKNPSATALDAEGLKVGGNVFLRGAVDSQEKVTPFDAEGEVNLLAGC